MRPLPRPSYLLLFALMLTMCGCASRDVPETPKAANAALAANEGTASSSNETGDVRVPMQLAKEATTMTQDNDTLRWEKPVSNASNLSQRAFNLSADFSEQGGSRSQALANDPLVQLWTRELLRLEAVEAPTDEQKERLDFVRAELSKAIKKVDTAAGAADLSALKYLFTVNQVVGFHQGVPDQPISDPTAQVGVAEQVTKAMQSAGSAAQNLPETKPTAGEGENN